VLVGGEDGRIYWFMDAFTTSHSHPYKHKRNGRKDLALQDLDRFLELRPESENAASAHLERGLIRPSQDVELALADFRQALELKAPDALRQRARLNIGYLLEYQRKDSEAVKQYDELLDQSYLDLDVLQRSAKLHLKLGNPDRALLREAAQLTR
jgi:tetratricopeptide (TPR) repeat protein